MLKNLYLIGGGGHSISCIDVIETTNEYSIKGIFDLPENVGKKILKYDIVGTDSDIKNYVSSENYFLITIGQIKTPQHRVKIYNLLKTLNAKMATIISPYAYVSKHAKVEEGTIIMNSAFINANVYIGQNCILNTRCLVEHGVVVNQHCHISTSAVVNGDCVIKEGSFIGSNSVLREGSVVESGSIIQAGSFYNVKK